MSADGSAGGWSYWPAPAKLNLFLHIVGQRPDGYHSLQTVFRLLDWGDQVGIKVRTDGVIRRSGPSAPGVAEADDLMIQAAMRLKQEAIVGQGADICVQKMIPAGGGFGGGSSDAATVLVVLNRLWGVNLALAELAHLGASLGADVPVFVWGASAWAEGVGELLTPLALPPAWYLLVDPAIHVPTRELFQAPDLTRNAAPAKISDFVSGNLLGNAFEPVLRRREPAIDAAFIALQQIGTPRLTGSGSGCFVEFPDRARAEAALGELQGGLRAWVAEGVDRSALHVALAKSFFDAGASPSG